MIHNTIFETTITLHNPEQFVEIISVTNFNHGQSDVQPFPSNMIVLPTELLDPVGKNSLLSNISAEIVFAEANLCTSSHIPSEVVNSIEIIQEPHTSFSQLLTGTVIDSTPDNIQADVYSTPKIQPTQNPHTLNQVLLLEKDINLRADSNAKEHMQDILYSKQTSNDNPVSIYQTNKENCSGIANQASGQSLEDSFPKSFTMPIKYLPKRKRMKLEASGKSKLPAAGTSDAWLQIQLEKEEKQRQKEEKIAQRKELQKQKKQLAEEKKKLDTKMKEEKKKVDEKMKELLQRIKKEKI